MAPNLLVKAVFVRGGYDGETKVKIRTDFILQNVFSFMIKNGGTFQAMPAMNSREEEVFKELTAIIEEFRLGYLNVIQQLVSNFTMDELPNLLKKVSGELFCEGVTWSRIIGFFVFVGELTLKQIANDKSDDVADKIYRCFSKLMKETLIDWVEQHGSWEGVLTLSVRRNSNPDLDATTSELNTSNPSDPTWLKYATGAFRIVGSLIHLASPHVQSYA